MSYKRKNSTVIGSRKYLFKEFVLENSGRMKKTLSLFTVSFHFCKFVAIHQNTVSKSEAKKFNIFKESLIFFFTSTEHLVQQMPRTETFLFQPQFTGQNSIPQKWKRSKKNFCRREIESGSVKIVS